MLSTLDKLQLAARRHRVALVVDRSGFRLEFKPVPLRAVDPEGLLMKLQRREAREMN